ncbi:hypothetical protein [Enterococcus sp.]|uniref:hypothetical protein n=1 Tax=Enterococcus sp. TaxID=35783 RepID=UPI0028A676B4|nr:hypothetical protein [Enterococcus sp.]
MPKEIPMGHQRSYALETYYYELVTYPGSAHFHFAQFVKAMESGGKPYFNIPAEWTNLDAPIAAVFILRDGYIKKAMIEFTAFLIHL